MTTAASQYCGPCQQWRMVRTETRMVLADRAITRGANTITPVKMLRTIIFVCGHVIQEIDP